MERSSTVTARQTTMSLILELPPKKIKREAQKSLKKSKSLRMASSYSLIKLSKKPKIDEGLCPSEEPTSEIKRTKGPKLLTDWAFHSTTTWQASLSRPSQTKATKS